MCPFIICDNYILFDHYPVYYPVYYPFYYSVLIDHHSFLIDHHSTFNWKHHADELSFVGRKQSKTHSIVGGRTEKA